MPSGWASRRGRPAGNADRSAGHQPLGAYDPAPVLWLGGGRLTGAVRAPATHRGAVCQVRAWRELTPRRSTRDAQRLRARPDRVGKVAHVAQALNDLDGVELAEDITGPSDVIVRIQAPGLDQLGRLVVFRIHVVDGVTRILTCTVLHR